MEAYQGRVIEERKQLDERLKKLETFIAQDVFQHIDPDEQNRLKRQLEVMTEYRNILDRRIEAFE